MPTKLKTPITLTLETAEEAVVVLHYLQLNIDLPAAVERTYPNFVAKFFDPVKDTLNRKYYALTKEFQKLTEFDHCSWEPEPPITVGSHQVIFNPDGSIQVGSTSVDAKTLDAIYSRLGKKQAEYPKFYYCGGSGSFYICRYKNDLGLFFSKYSEEGWRSSEAKPPIEEFDRAIQVTREECIKQLGGVDKLPKEYQ